MSRRKPYDKLRSPHWPAIRRAHLAREPSCQACGGVDQLEVHHIRPFHLHPDLELDQANLITLCEHPAHNCHFHVGHFFNWHAWNPRVRSDAARFYEDRQAAVAAIIPSKETT